MRGIIIAGTHSGCGKTTVTLGIMAALSKKGVSVQSFKSGPDFIDAGLHRAISDRPSRNLDIWMCGNEYVKGCFLRHSADASFSVVEGVMGMYDGDLSTADLAVLLGLPVLLVVDAYGMAESAGALVEGFRRRGLEIGLNLAVVLFNRVASPRHYQRLASSVREVTVLGYIPRDTDLEIPHRHLGLKVAEEEPLGSTFTEKIADLFLENLDFDAILGNTTARAIGANSNVWEKGDKKKGPASISFHTKPLVTIAVAYDRAFCFYYADNFDLLREAGAELVFFSPLADRALPAQADALYFGGGYPELYAGELAGNAPLLQSVGEWAESGRPAYAECGGLMYLSQGVFDFDDKLHRMAGVFPFQTRMNRGRSRLGYREVEPRENCLWGAKGERARGHEFHYSRITAGRQNAEGMIKYGKITETYSVKNNNGHKLDNEGFCYKNVLASYIHLHLGSGKDLAGNIVHFIMENRWKG